jgi:transposase
LTDILTGQVRLAGEDAFMGAVRRKYTPQYRRDAAHLVIDTGRAIRAVADEIGVGEQLLGRWVAIERSRMDEPPPAVDLNERAELERLRAENAQLRMDREFLKKAAAFFVAENASSQTPRSQ